MNYLGKNIRYLRKKRGISQDEFAEVFEYKNYTTVQKWESDKADPPIKVVRSMADYFGVGLDDLINKDLSAEHNSVKRNNSKGISIPVYGVIPAGLPIEAIEDIEDWEEIPESMAKTGDFFCLRVCGDSMEPKIFANDILVVRKQSDADNGDTVIAMVNGDDACCKRLMKYEGGVSLLSNNPAYEPMMFSNEDIENRYISIAGRVMEVRRKL